MSESDETLDLVAKKTVLRQFTYGLSVVAAAHGEERGIFTANWISQVSFDPPLVMVSVERASSTLPLIIGSGTFVIAPLPEGTRELAGALGKPKSRAGDKYEAVGIETVSTGCGILVPRSVLGYVTCKVISITDAGDSVMVLGQVVEAVSFDPGLPLTMRDAGFRHAG
ncbi:MAG: flavin reductase family protein [Thermomicrobiales bacterium]